MKPWLVGNALHALTPTCQLIACCCKHHYWLSPCSQAQPNAHVVSSLCRIQNGDELSRGGTQMGGSPAAHCSSAIHFDVVQHRFNLWCQRG